MRRKEKKRIMIVEIIELCKSILDDKDNPIYKHENPHQIEEIFLPEFLTILDRLENGRNGKKFYFTSVYYIIDSSDFKSIVALKILDFNKKFKLK